MALARFIDWLTGLAAKTTLSGAETVYVSDSGTSKKTTSQSFATLAQTGMAASDDPRLVPHDAPDVDSWTVPRFSGTPADNSDITSAAFTPPNSSLLVLCASADTTGGSGITLSVSGGSLVWTRQIKRDKSDSGAEIATPGHSAIWTAPVTTGASMTVSVRRTTANGNSNRITAKLYIVTRHTVASPIDASDAHSNVTDWAFTAALLTAASRSRTFFCATCWGTVSGVAASADRDDPFGYDDYISGQSAYKATSNPPGIVYGNFAAKGSGSPAWNWVALSIK